MTYQNVFAGLEKVWNLGTSLPGKGGSSREIGWKLAEKKSEEKKERERKGKKRKEKKEKNPKKLQKTGQISR